MQILLGWEVRLMSLYNVYKVSLSVDFMPSLYIYIPMQKEPVRLCKDLYHILHALYITAFLAGKYIFLQVILYMQVIWPFFCKILHCLTSSMYKTSCKSNALTTILTRLTCSCNLYSCKMIFNKLIP